MSHVRSIDFGTAPFQIIDGDRGKNYPKQDEFSDDGFCVFLSTSNVTKNGLDLLQCQFITEQKDSMLRKGKLQREDVVYVPLETRGYLRVPQQCGSEWKEPSERYEKLRM
jgi:type I restriction enzyme, S subunit